MADFRRYLLITDREGRRSREGEQLDIASWDELAKVASPADYDGWVLNISALKTRRQPKVFDESELDLLCHPRNFGHVLLGRGRIFIVGDFLTGFLTAASSGGGSGSRSTDKAASNEHTPYVPFAKLLGITRDPHPVDYRKVERSHFYENQRFYAYMDKVLSWDYSLKIDCDKEVIQRVYELGKTSFGTCLAATFQIGGGWINILPSLGTTSEADENYVIQHFLGFETDIPIPEWAQKFVLPGQPEIENRIKQAIAGAKTLLDTVATEKTQLRELERWKRLLYDDGESLEKVVKEALELLGGTVEKATPNEDGFRMTVPGHQSAVLEVKGTRKEEFSRKDLRQLSEWMEALASEQLTEIKGIFVGNAARESDPRTRKEAIFDQNNLDYAVFKKMVVLRSMDLYCLALLAIARPGTLKDFWDDLFSAAGGFAAGKYWAAVPQEFKELVTAPTPL